MEKNIDGNVTTIFGDGSATSKNGPVSVATINGPWGISIHPITQEVYIAENGAYNIRGWNRTSQIVRTVTFLSLIHPEFIAFSNDGTLYITAQANGLYTYLTVGLFAPFFLIIQIQIHLYFMPSHGPFLFHFSKLIYNWSL